MRIIKPKPKRPQVKQVKTQNAKFTASNKGRLFASSTVEKTPDGRIRLRKSSQKVTKPNYTKSELINILKWVDNPRGYFLEEGITLKDLKKIKNKNKESVVKLKDVRDHYPLNELASVYGKQEVINAYGNITEIIKKRTPKEIAGVFGAKPLLDYLVKNKGGLKGFRKSMEINKVGSKGIAPGSLESVIRFAGGSHTEVARYFNGYKGLVKVFGFNEALRNYGHNVIKAEGGIKAVIKKYQLKDIFSGLSLNQKNALYREYGPELSKAYTASELSRIFPERIRRYSQ